MNARLLRSSIPNEARPRKWHQWLTFGAWRIVLATGNLVPAATFVVAPCGNDQNPGTNEQPLATLQAARDAGRKAGQGPHRIILTAGDYSLATTLEFDARDTPADSSCGPRTSRRSSGGSAFIAPSAGPRPA